MIEVSQLCDEWWETTHEDSINLLDKVFTKDEELRRGVRKALISTTLAVTFCYSIAIEKGAI